jgi:hypothetical protein
MLLYFRLKSYLAKIGVLAFSQILFRTDELNQMFLSVLMKA